MIKIFYFILKFFLGASSLIIGFSTASINAAGGDFVGASDFHNSFKGGG
jgi:hypothetical protein